MNLKTQSYGGPTEFEIITAMAIYYFAEIHPVDIAIFEVGLGGRFDSTNIIATSVIHHYEYWFRPYQILGSTHKEIAFEKAGIIKQETSLISAVSQEEAQEVIINEQRKRLLFIS